MSHYLFLSSDDSLNYFHDNVAEDFTIQLPETLNLEGEWWCSLEEIRIQGRFKARVPKVVFVCCDLIQDSYVGDTKLPLLRKIFLSPRSRKIDLRFENTFSFRVSRRQVHRVRVYLRTEGRVYPSLVQGTLNCTLRLHHGGMETTLRGHGIG